MSVPYSNNTGTQTCVISTEHTLATLTIAGMYELFVDTNAIIASDTLVVRAYIKVLTGGTSRLAYQVSYSNVQTIVDVSTGPLMCMHQLVFKIEQTAGTGRAVPWEVVRF